MSILLIGGHDRMHDTYKDICYKQGHKIKVYTQMPPKFEKAIGSPDGIVLFIGAMSHKMVLTAVKEAKRKRIPIIRCHNSSGTSLVNSLRELKSSFQN